MEKSILVGMFEARKKAYEIDYILEELEQLTVSAGGNVVEVFFQRRNAPDKRYLLGKGKVSEIKNFAYANHVDLLIFYNQLSNIQQRNLENFFGLKVVDRTRLILDIFATRARSLEGKLQVELAQHLYLLPRLTGKGIELSRLGGGIGTRGPGETKLESDRRRIKKRISIINKRLSRVIKNRNVQRKNRDEFPVPVVSMVGYTSAGKSTLFKKLTGEQVFISDKMFSTLDPLLRRVELNEVEPGYYFLLSDTVGFIRQMPRELFQSFRATLEEVHHADMVLHVIDISRSDYLNQKEEVEKVLENMNIPREKVIDVYNKIDLLEPGSSEKIQKKNIPDSRKAIDGGRDPLLESTRKSEVFLSAKNGQGVLALKKILFSAYFSQYQRYSLVIPPDVISLNSIRNWAIVTHHDQQDGLLRLDVLCSREKMIKFREKFGGYIK
jgi:GTP-binding protein HflX